MDLAVDQADAPRVELAHARDERDLRRIGRAREHRLAEERRAERDAVQPADELVARATPRSSARSRASCSLVYASTISGISQVPVCPGRGTDAQPSSTPRERGVHRQLVRPAPDRLAQALLDDQIARRHHHPRIRRVPQDRQVLGVPGEDALRVAEQQALGPQIAAEREQSILGEVDRRKHEAIIEPEDRHPASVPRGGAAARDRGAQRRRRRSIISAGTRSASPAGRPRRRCSRRSSRCPRRWRRRRRCSSSSAVRRDGERDVDRPERRAAVGQLELREHRRLAR